MVVRGFEASETLDKFPQQKPKWAQWLLSASAWWLGLQAFCDGPKDEGRAGREIDTQKLWQHHTPCVSEETSMPDIRLEENKDGRTHLACHLSPVLLISSIFFQFEIHLAAEKISAVYHVIWITTSKRAHLPGPSQFCSPAASYLVAKHFTQLHPPLHWESQLLNQFMLRWAVKPQNVDKKSNPYQ
jgi:hypothetical protein